MKSPGLIKIEKIISDLGDENNEHALVNQEIGIGLIYLLVPPKQKFPCERAPENNKSVEKGGQKINR
jgi:hypothetical protein